MWYLQKQEYYVALGSDKDVHITASSDLNNIQTN